MNAVRRPSAVVMIPALPCTSAAVTLSATLT
jgi:hypothetical protein